MPEAPNSVECPVCGETFDPDAAPGGYCPNTDCGEYRWEPDDADESDTGPSVGDAQSGDPADHSPVDGSPTVDESTHGAGPADGPADDAQAEDGPDRVECPDCGERVPDMDHCVSCGTALDVAGEDDGNGSQATPSCPSCEEEVDPEWAACPYCGTDLEDAETDPGDHGHEHEDEDEAHLEDESGDGVGEVPERVVVEVGDTEITAGDGDTVGRRVRSAHVRAGGDEGEAQYIHREHVRFEREEGAFHLVNEGRNGTRLNGERLDLDERRALEDGDEVEFSEVATGTVRLE